MLRNLFDRFSKVHPATVAVLAGLKVMVTVVVVAVTLYVVSLSAIHHEVEGNLVRLAEVAASTIDGDLHRTFKDPKQESTPQYARAIAPLGKAQQGSDQIAYIYTMILDHGKAKFVLDPTEAGDADGDGTDDKSHIMQEYPEVSPVAMRVLTTHKAEAEEEPSSDEWGTFISGYAPFYDSKGNFAGIVGVDLKASDYLTRLAGVRKAQNLALLLGLFLTLIISTMAYQAQAGSIRARQEILDREADLAEAKAELESQNEMLIDQHAKLESAVKSREEANERMRAASQRYQRLFEELPIACITYDADGVVRDWNRQFDDLFGIAVTDIFQKNIADIFPDIAQEFRSVIGGHEVRDIEWTHPLPDGRSYTLLTRAFAIQIDGHHVGGVGAIVDITERKLLERKLQELSITDGLTGIRNRRSLQDELARNFELARRYDKPLSVLLLDVDKFKSFNDSFGHQAGDEVLKRVASALEGAARASDLVARYGGEEFCVLLPETSAEEAMLAAERFRVAIEAQPWVERAVTASFGVSTLSADHRDPDNLLKDADDALYVSKESGRNRCTHASTIDHNQAA
ncbi:MAG: diguanylate cyclase [Fimbriimonadales bacterium]